VDAPLVEVGDITANLIGSQTNPRAWITNLPPTSIIYSWVMNNHWHTNYRAEQDDTVVFRYVLRPHNGYSPIAAARFGVESSQPLIVCKASGDKPAESRILIEPDDVIATTLKPSDDGKALILRLFAAGGKPANVKLLWNNPAPAQIYLSDTSEKPLKKIDGTITIPAWGVATIRAQMP
jgi:alpha-mannosidase